MAVPDSFFLCLTVLQGGLPNLMYGGLRDFLQGGLPDAANGGQMLHGGIPQYRPAKKADNNHTLLLCNSFSTTYPTPFQFRHV